MRLRFPEPGEAPAREGDDPPRRDEDLSFPSRFLRGDGLLEEALEDDEEELALPPRDRLCEAADIRL